MHTGKLISIFIVCIFLNYTLKNIVKVLLTGQADSEAIARTRKQANLYAYIPKPWDEANLIEILQSELRKTDE